MISADDVKKLAGLARLALTSEEIETLRGEIGAIVEYIDVIQQVQLPEVPASTPYLEEENVLRDDVNPHEAGIYTDDIVKQFPHREGNYLKVRKILP